MFLFCHAVPHNEAAAGAAGEAGGRGPPARYYRNTDAPGIRVEGV